jgi:hypothetical protein
MGSIKYFIAIKIKAKDIIHVNILFLLNVIKATNINKVENIQNPTHKEKK